MGKCRHLEDDIDDSEVARKRGHERMDSPPVSAERSKSLRQREGSMPAETRCVEPTRSVEPAHSAFHRTSLYGAINSKVSHEFPGGKTQFYQSSNSSSSLGTLTNELNLPPVRIQAIRPRRISQKGRSWQRGHSAGRYLSVARP